MFQTIIINNAAWKLSKYGVISGPYFPAFGLITESISLDSVQMQESTDQKLLRIWTIFTQCKRRENQI